MIFKTVLKYKILEWALDNIFNKIRKNFIVNKSNLPEVSIFKVSGDLDDFSPRLVCKTIYNGKVYTKSISLEMIQDISAQYGNRSDEFAGEVSCIFYMEFHDVIDDIEFLYKLEDVIYDELREMFKR